jgi:hypothetical protein
MILSPGRWNLGKVRTEPPLSLWNVVEMKTWSTVVQPVWSHR